MASAGVGSASHMIGELFKLMTGVNMLHAPYRGNAPVMTYLLSGQVQVLFDALVTSGDHIRAGRLHALAVTTTKRLEDNGLLGRGDIETDNAGGFGRKVRVVALAPGLASLKIDLVAAKESPDILNSTSPSACASSGPVQRANPSAGGLSSTPRIRLSVAFV
jgi:tripartite-type tricarboxylate transporter receptor subunit TctC